MRLYLSADSQNDLGYYPDTLTIEKNGQHYEYDISGETDYNETGLNTRTKGELKLRHDDTDEYLPLTESETEQLIDFLIDANAEKIIAIYPIPEHETETEKLDSDILTNCQGLFCYKNTEIHFKFFTEFYGI